MMKQEFEALAGYEVSVADYNNIIEPMYMATNLSKAEFAKVICKERFALKSREEIIQEMKEIVGHVKQICDHFAEEVRKEAQIIEKEIANKPLNISDGL